MKRPTIADIAREAGVSKGAVSYALNNRPGVSDQTRARILAIADRIGFRASAAARALAGAPANMVGLALRRPASTLGVEPFFMELVSGLEAELSLRSYALLLQLVPDDDPDAEIEVYRQWWIEGRVDGVLLCDVRAADPRIPAVAEIGVPAVVIGPPTDGELLPSLWSDDAVSVAEAVEHLAGLGHRRIARVAGIPELAHTGARSRAFAESCDRLGVAEAPTVWTDYTGEAGAQATRELLAGRPRPTAIVYDNDIMAIAGLATAQELGYAVPAELSIVAWDDSPVCGLVHPPLTALTRDIVAYGANAARLLLSVIAGDQAGSRLDEPAHLIARASTAPPPRQEQPGAAPRAGNEQPGTAPPPQEEQPGAAPPTGNEQPGTAPPPQEEQPGAAPPPQEEQPGAAPPTGNEQPGTAPPPGDGWSGSGG